MKKILSIFAAALVALAVNATPVEPGAGTLKAAISAAEAGAVIELATGVFEEESAIGLGKNLTIKAADGAVPVIKAVGFGIQGGAKVTFEGIKFDASTTASHLIYANDATAGNQLICEGCEFYDYTLNSSLIHVGGSSLLDVCTINNCYIHNIKKSFIFNENKTNAFDLTVSNSTIANITTDAGSYYAGVIDSRATSGTVRVNQCTFYNVLAMNTDYAAVGKISASGAIVSNSIFAMPTSTDNLRAIRDVSAANNCLTYNYTKDSNRGIHSDVARNNCIFGQDPLFADAANDDYTLDEENSPAKGAGQGGTHLGDPRWWPASWKPAEIIDVTSVALDAAELTIDVNETAFLHATVLPNDATDPSVTWTSSDKAVATVVDGAVKGIAAGTATITAKAGDKTATCVVTVSDAIPSTDFAAPYFLKGTKAVLDGNIYLSEADSLHYKDKSVCGTATWKINVLTNGIFEATANYKTGSSSGAKLRIVILDKDENQVGDSLTHEYYSKDGDVELSGSITLLEAGVYTVKLVNIQPWSSAKLNGITLKKTGEVPAKYYITGSKELVGEEKAWHADAIKVINDSYIFEDLAAGSYQLKIARNGTWEGAENVYGYDALTSKIGGLYRGYGTDEDNICFTLADAGDVKVTYIHGEKYTVEGDFVMPTVQIAGSWKDDWTDFRTFEPASDKLTASVTIEFTNNYYEFKLIENGTWKGKWAGEEAAKYYLTRSVLGVNNFEEYKNNLVITPDVAGEYKFTWTYGTGELTVEFPELPDPVYYLGGSFTDWGTGKELMVENDGIWSKTINFESADYQSFKIVRSVATIVPSEDWLGLAEAYTITATESNLVIGTGNEAIGITPTKTGAYVFTFNPDGNKVSVTYPTATALDNTNADAKVIKTIENGQLVIIKNGIRYNAQGAVVK